MISENESRAKLHSNKPVFLCIQASAPLLVHAGSGSAPHGVQSFLSSGFYVNWDGRYMKTLYLKTLKTFRIPGRKKPHAFGKLSISVKSMINLLLFRKVRD